MPHKNNVLCSKYRSNRCNMHCGQTSSIGCYMGLKMSPTGFIIDHRSNVHACTIIHVMQYHGQSLLYFSTWPDCAIAFSFSENNRAVVDVTNNSHVIIIVLVDHPCYSRPVHSIVSCIHKQYHNNYCNMHMVSIGDCLAGCK